MVDAVIGEIRIFAGNYPPEGWLLCDGSLLKITDYQAFFSLVGTTYGGDGRTTFGVPDLRGRLPICQGQGTGLTNRVVGQSGGSNAVQLTAATMPLHTHSFSVSGNEGTTNVVSSGAALAVPQPQTGGTIYAYAVPGTTGNVEQTFANGAITQAPGGGQEHQNLMPYLSLTYIIAAVGLYPDRPS